LSKQILDYIWYT